MPTYTNPWDETQPAGSAAANTLDTIIQTLKKDLRERLNEIYTDFTADPAVPKDSVTGKATGLKLWIPFMDFMSTLSDFGTGLVSDKYILSPGGNNEYLISLACLPAGVTITEIMAFASIQNGGTATVKLMTQDVAMTGAASAATQLQLLSLATNANTLFNQYTTGTISQVLPDAWNWILVSPEHQNNKWKGLRVTYDSPSSLVRR